jgi:hypothetical protein
MFEGIMFTRPMTSTELFSKASRWEIIYVFFLLAIIAFAVIDRFTGWWSDSLFLVSCVALLVSSLRERYLFKSAHVLLEKENERKKKG